MAEDESVVGRRGTYYDQHGSERLICSDSEEDLMEPKELNEIIDAEDQILWYVKIKMEICYVNEQYFFNDSSEITMMHQ